MQILTITDKQIFWAMYDTTKVKMVMRKNIFSFSISWNCKCYRGNTMSIQKWYRLCKTVKLYAKKKSYTTIQDMYAEGWRYKGTFNIKRRNLCCDGKGKIANEVIKCFVYYYDNISIFSGCVASIKVHKLLKY